MIRLTVSARYTSGAEVLLHETAATYGIDDAPLIASQIRGVIVTHGDDIAAGSMEIVVRAAARRFQADGDVRPARKPPAARPAVPNYKFNRF